MKCIMNQSQVNMPLQQQNLSLTAHIKKTVHSRPTGNCTITKDPIKKEMKQHQSLKASIIYKFDPENDEDLTVQNENDNLQANTTNSTSALYKLSNQKIQEQVPLSM